MAKTHRPNHKSKATEIGVSKPRWSEGDKARAVAAYSTVGSYSKAADLTGIPEMTMRYWAKQPWFLEEMHRVDQADNAELKTVYTKIIKKATMLLEERLDGGDEVVTKDGEIIKKAVSAKELAIISGIAMEKRKQAMETPSMVAIQNSAEKLLSLMHEFAKFNESRNIKPEPIEVEYAEQPGVQAGLYAGTLNGDISAQESASGPQQGQINHD